MSDTAKETDIFTDKKPDVQEDIEPDIHTDNEQDVKDEEPVKQPDNIEEDPDTAERPRTLTEKGLADKVQRLKNKQKAALAAVTKSRNELARLLIRDDNLHEVKTNLDRYNEACEVYHDSYIAHCALLTDEAIEGEESKYLQRQANNTDFQVKVSNWIVEAEQRLADHMDTRSSRSSTSSAKSRSSISSRSSRVKEKVKLDELMVEKQMLNQTRKIKEMELEQTNKIREMQLEVEIAKSEARNAVFEEDETKASPAKNPEGKDLSTTKPKPIDEEYDVNQTAEPTIQANSQLIASPIIQPTSSSTAELLVETHRQMFLPSPEVPKFSGDPIEFKSFIMSFDARIVPHVTSERNKLFYLDQQLQGEPKDLIGGCLFMAPETGYVEARKLLDNEYGDTFKVASAYLQKLSGWQTIRQDEGIKLKQLSHFLMKCNHAMQNVSHMNVLNHAPNMQMLVAKLPVYLQNKWRDNVARLRQKSEVSFKDLVQFVKQAADSANDPVFGKEALGQKTTKSVKPNSSSFATNVNTPYAKNFCLCCKENHDLDDCHVYKQKSLADRRSFLKEKRVCFGCYGFNHLSRGCVSKRTCSVCQKRHPTGLHDYSYVSRFTANPSNLQSASQNRQSSFQSANQDQQPNLPSANPANLSSAGNITSNVNNAREHGQLSSSLNVLCSSDVNVLQAILPVKVTCQSGISVDTYALYDNGSSGCFLTDDLKEKLNASGHSTSLSLQTMHGHDCIATESVKDLVVSDIIGNNSIQLPKAFTRQEIPVSHSQIPKKEHLQSYVNMQYVTDQLPPYYPTMEIGLLIGSNCPRALEPLEVVPTDGEGPFAVRYRHGWKMNGPVRVEYNAANEVVSCNRVMFTTVEKAKECNHHKEITSMFESDFNVECGDVPDEKGWSQEDHKFITTVQRQHAFEDGHHILPLPFREQNPSITNNRDQAESRLKWQKKKMQRDDNYRQDYKEFMEKIICKGYAYKVPEQERQTGSDSVHYLVHHGVYHPQKKKLRVVFDGSAKYNGSSLNDNLLQGPDLANSLVGVLTRFRQAPIAFTADIESMFYQVRVPQKQHDYLRFLWWTDGELDKEPDEYRMAVHIFGAASSPTIANYALRSTAEGIKETDSEAASTIERNFYVDDCLRSVETEEEAVELVNRVREGCAKGGFRLTKFISNSKRVLMSIPESEASVTVQDLDLQRDNIVQRALGIQWRIDTDKLGYSINKQDKPYTRRGLLSIVSSIFDPIVFLAPVILPAKKILQEMCADDKLGWDDKVSPDQEERWKEWLSELEDIKGVTVNRCLKPSDFGKIVSTELHVFSDASTTGYGSVAYLRIRNEEGKVHVVFLLGKARLAPIKPISIPRLELTAAKVSVHVARFLKRELDMKIDETVYHTDSTTVLHYLQNTKRRFPVFVANRVKAILDFSKVEQWRYVDSKSNPADLASRGMRSKQLLGDNMWTHGPHFLKLSKEHWPQQPGCYDDNSVEDENLEVHAMTTAANETTANATNDLITHYSTFYRLKRAVAIYRRFFDSLKCKDKRQPETKKGKLSLDEIEDAEYAVIKYVQNQAFQKEIELKRGREYKPIPRSSPIHNLDPQWDEDNEVLRVGGRLRRAEIDDKAKFPILLPRKSHITEITHS